MSDLGLAFGGGKAIRIPFWTAIILTFLMIVGLLVVVNRTERTLQTYSY